MDIQTEKDISFDRNGNEQNKQIFNGIMGMSYQRFLSSVLALFFGLGVALTVIYWPEKEAGYRFMSNTDDSTLLSCPVYQSPALACIGSGNALCEEDMRKARIAWKYFENNYQPKTGLVNAANQYPSTTMWDTGSSLGATIAAKEFGIITQKEFDDLLLTI